MAGSTLPAAAPLRCAALRTVVAATLAVAPAAAGAAAALGYVTSAASLMGRVTVVDARAQAACLKRSIDGAHCLPAKEFLDLHGRLAGFREIYWLLGTAGLSGSEHVLVVGDDPTERDFVAGMLYLCGQRKVSILTLPLSQGAGLPAARLGTGMARAMTRNPYYQATVREGDIVLRSELARTLAAGTQLLDGCNAADCRGERMRALAGAWSLPLSVARSRQVLGRIELPAGRRFLAYGRDPFESVAYFALLRAGTGAAVSVLLDVSTERPPLAAHHVPQAAAAATHARRRMR